LANWAIEKKVYYTGSLYDLPLALSMAWVTGVGLVAYTLAPRQEPRRNFGGHGVWTARLGMITIFSLPLFAAWSLSDTSAPPNVRTFRIVVTLGTMVVMGVMVFLKQHLLDDELMQLLRSSQESFENLQKLQVQLVQSEKLAALGQLVGGAAHELNNPLTAMLGYSDLLAGTSLTEPQRALADRIAHQVRRTKSLVSSLLNFAKQAPAQKVLLDVNALAKTAMKLSQPQLEARNIRVDSKLADDLPQILGDSNQLLQVCMHVTNNAAHTLSNKGGVLTVTTWRQGDFVLLEFSDQGSGAVNAGEFFDPFYASHPAGRGKSLGLSTCYGIIQEHRGRILCENRTDGRAIFRIELPLATTSSASAHEESLASLLKTNNALSLGPSP
jgi:signal transduction histidine kinase